MPARKLVKAVPPKNQRNKIYGRGFGYAVKALQDPDPAIGTAPYSEIDARTLMQRAWHDGYVARMTDEHNETGLTLGKKIDSYLTRGKHTKARS